MSIRFNSLWETFHRNRLKKPHGPIDEDVANAFVSIKSTTLQNTVLNVSSGKSHIPSTYRRSRLGCTAVPSLTGLGNKRIKLANCTPKWSPVRSKIIDKIIFQSLIFVVCCSLNIVVSS